MIHLGTISAGTLGTEDLLNAFTLTLLDVTHDTHSNLSNLGSEATANLYNRALEIRNTLATGEDEPEDAGDVVAALIDALNEYAPPFVYFGNLEGDGADFGFWPDVDRLQEAVQEAIESGDYHDGDETHLEMEGLIVQVSDHGNVVVMDMDRNELWSVV